MSGNKIGTTEQNILLKELQHSYTTESIEDAEDMLIAAKEKLFDVNNWAKISGLDSIHFILTDTHKKEVHRIAHKGDYVRIDMNNDVYWLHIDIVEYDDYPDENKESFTICLNFLENKLINLSVERINSKLFSSLTATPYIVDNEATASSNSLPVLAMHEWDLLLRSFISF